MYDRRSSWQAIRMVPMTIDAAAVFMTVDAAARTQAWTWQATATCSVGVIDCLILSQKSVKTQEKFFKNPILLR